MLLSDLMNRKTVGEVGIEVEQEFFEPFPYNTPKGWVAHDDGSLRRNGKEFVTNGPIDRKDVSKYLTALDTTLSKASKINDHDSPRTSIHIHINAMDLTPMQVWNQIVTYWIMDTCLVELCGIYRVTNLFCLRLRDGTAILDYAKSELSPSYRIFNGFSTESLRYSSQNLMALHKFGSLEYRSKGGKFDKTDVQEWVDCLLSIKDFAKDFKSPVEILELFYQIGARAFAKRALTDTYFTKVYGIKNHVAMMEYNADLLIDLVSSIDWESTMASKVAATIKYNNSVKAKSMYDLGLSEAIRNTGTTTAPLGTVTPRPVSFTASILDDEF